MDILVAEATGSISPWCGELWREYWESFGLPLDFQGFGEELQGLPGVYGADGWGAAAGDVTKTSLPGPSLSGVWTGRRES